MSLRISNVTVLILLRRCKRTLWLSNQWNVEHDMDFIYWWLCIWMQVQKRTLSAQQETMTTGRKRWIYERFILQVGERKVQNFILLYRATQNLDVYLCINFSSFYLKFCTIALYEYQKQYTIFLDTVKCRYAQRQKLSCGMKLYWFTNLVLLRKP